MQLPIKAKASKLCIYLFKLFDYFNNKPVVKH